MRRRLITAAGLLAALPAAASSIEVPKDAGAGGSIVSVSCTDCPPPVAARKPSYVVPTIAPNTDRTEIKDVGGRMKIVRTEAWLGGSPILFVTTPSEAQLATLKAPGEPPAGGPGPLALAPADRDSDAAQAALPPAIDRQTTTAVIDAPPGAMTAASAVVAPSREFDGKAFRLRLE